MRTDPPEGFNLPEFLEGIYTFQKWEIFPGQVTQGPKDVSEHLRRLNVPTTLAGLRVLDIAPWNGFFGFECVRRGAAEVVSLGPDDPDLTGYNKVRDLLQIDNCKYIRASVYDLSPDIHGTFDIVFFLGLIYHLRHPLLALDRIYNVASGRLFANSPIINSGIYDKTLSEDGRSDFPTRGTSLQHMPITYFSKGDETGDAYNWFMPNSPAFRDFVEFVRVCHRQLCGRWRLGVAVGHQVPPPVHPRGRGLEPRRDPSQEHRGRLRTPGVAASQARAAGTRRRWRAGAAPLAGCRGSAALRGSRPPPPDRHPAWQFRAVPRPA